MSKQTKDKFAKRDLQKKLEGLIKETQEEIDLMNHRRPSNRLTFNYTTFREYNREYPHKRDDELSDKD